jgi:hypothetical protein
MRRAALAALIVLAAAGAATAAPISHVPPNAGFDYQIGGDYPLPEGVSVVSRDWFAGDPAPEPAYSICYINAFQTQPDIPGVDRPDERRNWPRRLVLTEAGDDPNWEGEYPIDLRSARKRRAAAAWVGRMIDGCADKGYRAVEYDNLDAWTRFDGPFGKPETLDYAHRITRYAHRRGLAVGQKNTVELTVKQVRRVGFDFAVVESCGRYDECERYRRAHGDRVLAIEYRRKDFAATCAAVGDEIAVVLRDRAVSTPRSDAYVFDAC